MFAEHKRLAIDDLAHLWGEVKRGKGVGERTWPERERVKAKDRGRMREKRGRKGAKAHSKSSAFGAPP